MGNRSCFTTRNAEGHRVTSNLPGRSCKMTRRALGRGLSALLGEVETTTVGLEQVLLSLIDPNPSQPRRPFPEEGLRELAHSIPASCVVLPIMVQRGVW